MPKKKKMSALPPEELAIRRKEFNEFKKISKILTELETKKKLSPSEKTKVDKLNKRLKHLSETAWTRQVANLKVGMAEQILRKIRQGKIKRLSKERYFPLLQRSERDRKNQIYRE